MKPSRPLGMTIFGALLVLTMASCQGFGGLGKAACPQLRNDVDALSASYSANLQANAKIRAFVQAAKDVAGVAAQMERLAAEACLRMGSDLGVPPQQMAPRDNRPGARAQAACNAVGMAIDGILRQGIQVQVSATPPQCQASAQAEARCQGACGAQVAPGQAAPSADAECNASCRAHANVQAQCTPPLVQVQVSQGVEMAARLAATLQANLPQLLYAQIALGQRLIGDVQVVVDVGRQLPRIVGQAGAQAMACIAAASEASIQASASINVSIQASASVTGRVGAG